MASIEHRAIHDKHVKIINIKDYEEEWFYDEHSKEYFMEVEDMEKFYGEKEWEIPKYVYGCYISPFSLDVDTILESEAYDHHEDILDSIDGVSDLRKAIEEFNNVNKVRGTYYYDVRVIVKLADDIYEKCEVSKNDKTDRR